MVSSSSRPNSCSGSKALRLSSNASMSKTQLGLETATRLASWVAFGGMNPHFASKFPRSERNSDSVNE